MPVSSVRRSTAKLPSNADEPFPPAITDPLSAVVFASKLPPIVIGQITRPPASCTSHGFEATPGGAARTSVTIVDFIERSSTASFEKIANDPRGDFPMSLNANHPRPRGDLADASMRHNHEWSRQPTFSVRLIS